jgi:hypothetical protein
MDDVIDASHLLISNPTISNEVLDDDIDLNEQILHESKNLLVTMKEESNPCHLDLNCIIPGNSEEAAFENDISQIVNNNVLLQ